MTGSFCLRLISLMFRSSFIIGLTISFVTEIKFKERQECMGDIIQESSVVYCRYG